MELLYLYIENFRNLEDVALNFSFDHTITFKKTGNVLDIRQDKQALKQFFGSEISNVSAIIGKNSSGKSNILEFICYLTKGGGNRAKRYIMLFKVQHSSRLPAYDCYTNIIDLDIAQPRVKFYNDVKSIKDLSVIFFSNVNDGRSQNFPKEIIDLSQNRYLRITERRNDYQNQLRFILSDYFDKIGFETPRALVFSIRDHSWNSSRYANLQQQFPEISDEVFQYLRKRPQRAPLDLKRAFRSWLLLYILSELKPGFGKSGVGITFNSSRENVTEQGIGEILSRFLDDTVFVNSYDFHKIIGKLIVALFEVKSEIGRITAKDVRALLAFDELVDLTNPELISDKLSGKKQWAISFSTSNQRTLKGFAGLFDYPELLEIEWIGVSSGQLAFLNLFSQLHSAIRRVSQHDNILICIDEGDLYLHPQWQKEFLGQLIAFLPVIYKRKNVQLILTSHSPFLVTDLPRQNLILLDRKLDGRCLVVSVENSLDRTFGANVYDLYHGSFFLDDGALSDFALSKIKQAIAIAQNEEASVEEKAIAAKITELIGEDMIRVKLQKMLNNA